MVFRKEAGEYPLIDVSTQTDSDPTPLQQIIQAVAHSQRLSIDAYLSTTYSAYHNMDGSIDAYLLTTYSAYPNIDGSTFD